MTACIARPRADLRILALLAIGAVALAGCGLPGGEPPVLEPLVVEVTSTDPHVATPIILDRLRATIEIEVTRENDGTVGSMSIDDVDGLPTGWSTSTGSSCTTTPTESSCTATITVTGPDDTNPGDYPVEVELDVDGETVLVDVTLTVP